MLDFGNVCFGTIKECANVIYTDLKNGNRKSWDIGGYSGCIYTNDDEVSAEIGRGVDTKNIIREFEGWAGMKVLEDYPFDGNDMVLIGDQYGGGCFVTVVLPEGIKYCENYEPKEHWVAEIAKMICSLMDSVDGYGNEIFDSYICLEDGI